MSTSILLLLALTASWVYISKKHDEVEERFNRVESLLVENGRINRDTLYTAEQIRDRAIYLTEVKPKKAAAPKKTLANSNAVKLNRRGNLVYAPKKKTK